MNFLLSTLNNQTMIFFDKVSKIYSHNSIALDDVSLSIIPKEFVALMGHSGAGKSTLLKLLLAEERPSSGSVYFESVNIHSIPRRKLPSLRRKIGMVFQEFRLLSNKTVYENVAFAMEASGKPPKEIEESVPYVLDLVDLMDKSSRFPDELSGGERQKVAIARAIINQPDLLVADEPTGNLDLTSAFEVVGIFEKINKLGTTIIIATHNKEVADAVGRRTVTMEKGKIIKDDKKGKHVFN